ncbi:lysoplasmalogenase family protein, partial [Streptomyces collinus]
SPDLGHLHHPVDRGVLPLTPRRGTARRPAPALALVTMALTARVLGPRAAWGGLVFLGSDLLVGLGAAGIGFPGQGVLVMVTYTLALALITMAVAAAEPGAADGVAPAPSAPRLRT